MINRMMAFIKGPGYETERIKALNTAKSIVALEETEGWAHYVKAAQALIESMTPDVSQFDPKSATLIASQMAFISGIKRCIGLMGQQKDILQSLKRPEEN